MGKEGRRFLPNLKKLGSPRLNFNEFTEILEVHHIDGDRSNNEPENLRIICPNCHRALTKGLIELKEKVQG